MLPSALISLLTTLSHEDNSSASSSTNNIDFVEPRGSGIRRTSELRKREKNDFFVATGVVSFTLCVWDICSTQCFPGMASLANATEFFPNGTTFSGFRSKFPSPLYCNKNPLVTSIKIFRDHSILLNASEARREWCVSFFSSFHFLGASLSGRLLEVIVESAISVLSLPPFLWA